MWHAMSNDDVKVDRYACSDIEDIRKHAGPFILNETHHITCVSCGRSRWPGDDRATAHERTQMSRDDEVRMVVTGKRPPPTLWTTSVDEGTDADLVISSVDLETALRVRPTGTVDRIRDPSGRVVAVGRWVRDNTFAWLCDPTGRIFDPLPSDDTPDR